MTEEGDLLIGVLLYSVLLLLEASFGRWVCLRIEPSLSLFTALLRVSVFALQLAFSGIFACVDPSLSLAKATAA
jgi:hypothetical protein